MSLSASASVPTSPRSHHGGDRRHLRSRSSLAALRAALQNYQIPPEADHDLDTQTAGSGSGSDGLVSELDLDSQYRDSERDHAKLMDGRAILRSPFDDGNEMMDALVDIHRVLYRGRENLGEDVNVDWDSEEIKRVTQRWFEGDCGEFLVLLTVSLLYPLPCHVECMLSVIKLIAAYDHPLVQLTSRSSLLSHFQLLHLLSIIYLPSISPRAMVEHTRTITSALKSRILGEHTLTIGDIERRPSAKGKERAWDDDLDEEVNKDKRGWWKVWDVRADCREIGGMECYGMPVQPSSIYV